MRHNVGHRKLGRVTEHRLALLRNLATALLRHEHIETTLPKAKELRPFVERLITVAKRGVLAGDGAAAGKGGAKTLNARRLVLKDLQDRDVVAKLFDALAPRYAERPGGYTRILKTGFRRGDGADTAMIELVGSEFDPKAAKAEAEAAAAEGGESAKPKKSVGERLRATAGRVRGNQASVPGKAKAGGQSRGARKVTTPRKAGGS
ncbi:MAG: 50S ribosomal protein L17 [Vicinamibacterales bacterium]